MAEVRFQVDDAFLKNLLQATGANKSTDVARDALTLLNWAVAERKKGRDITSSQDGSVATTLAMPALDKVSQSDS